MRLNLYLYVIQGFIRIFSGICIAVVVVAITNLKVETMHHDKDTQKSIVLIEAAVWLGWTLFFGVIYLFVKLMSLITINIA